MVRHPYAVAVRLCTIASERWNEIDAAYYPGNILRERHPRFIGLIYAWCLERVPHDKIEEWERELADPLPWQDADSEAAIQAESDSFLNMMSKQG